jgi:hypothetical protein
VIRRLWHDPVWSKVISTGILAVIAALISLAWTNVTGVSVQYFWMFGALCFAIIIGIIIGFLLSRNNREPASKGWLWNASRRARTTLIEHPSPHLYSLNQCVAEIATTVTKIPPNSTVFIDHLGLDLIHAWDHIERMLKSDLYPRDIRYRLLLLSDKLDAPTTENEEVRVWAKNAARSLEVIKRECPAIRDNFARRQKHLRIEARKYCEIPTIHGFRITEPEPIKRCYVAICRWGGMHYLRYEWGDLQYHRIIGESGDPVGRDLLRIFDGYFEHLWSTARAFEVLVEI